MNNWLDRSHFGDCRDTMRAMITAGVKVQTIVTSPPYWGLRAYLPDGHPAKAAEIGFELTLREFIAALVDVFSLCRELLADDGTAFVNIGDSYVSGGGSGMQGLSGQRAGRRFTAPNLLGRTDSHGLKPRDLMGQPWRLAFALQDAGWYLRQDIVWSKPAPMPESVRDRCTKAHEYLFLLSKSERYYWDYDAMQEPASGGAHARGPGNRHHAAADAYAAGDEHHRTKSGLVAYAERKRAAGVNPKAVGGLATGPGAHDAVSHNRGARVARPKQNASFSEAVTDIVSTRNRRSVWTIPSEPYSEAHFATFPQALVEPCVLAGSRVGHVVFDPFFGSGTTGQVAQRLGRRFIGCELNRDYEPLQRDRLRHPALALEVA